MKTKLLSFILAVFLFPSCVSLKEHAKVSSKEIQIQKEELNQEVVEKKIILKVLIAKKSNDAVFESDSGIKIKDNAMELSKKYTVSLEKGNIYVNGNKAEGDRLFFQAKDNLIKFGKNRYRGSFMIKNMGDEMLVINLVELEKYLYGVLPSEISSKWDIEALKAQAVAARSFAIYQKINSKYPDYDLDSTVLSQVYKGYDVEKETANKAIESTYGEVLTYENKVIQAFFHSNSGGRTESSEEAWGGNLDYLKSVDDPFCISQPHYKWTLVLDKTKVYDVLRKNSINPGEIYDISPNERTESNRIKSLRISGSNGSFTVKAKDFRAYFGVDAIKSTNFDLEQRNDKFYFRGFGWGHGVGLSQEGADGMADKGFSYSDILKHFYTGVKIMKIEIK